MPGTIREKVSGKMRAERGNHLKGRAAVAAGGSTRLKVHIMKLNTEREARAQLNTRTRTRPERINKTYTR